MPLTTDELDLWLKKPFPEKLVITPLLLECQAEKGKGSIDIRLGQQFLISDRASVDVVNPLTQTDSLMRAYLRDMYVPLGESFVLHPRQFALGATLEYLRFPKRLNAHVMGRSSWARVGLVIAMATYVQPSYAGSLTLELQNLGDAPIILNPGLSIAQLVFEENTDIENEDKGQLACAIGPEQRFLLSEEEKQLLNKLRM